MVKTGMVSCQNDIPNGRPLAAQSLNRSAGSRLWAWFLICSTHKLELQCLPRVRGEQVC